MAKVLLLKMGMYDAVVAEGTGLTPEEIRELKKHSRRYTGGLFNCR